MANNLETGKKVMAVSMLCEGNSIRSIERITGVHRDTIMRLGLRMGESCQQIMDAKMRGLNCKQVECDEIWGFIGAKRKNANRVGAYGDVWTFIALDADTKADSVFHCRQARFLPCAGFHGRFGWTHGKSHPSFNGFPQSLS
jgi:hypothetical protein